MTSFRLEKGGRLLRSRPLRMTFDGRPIVGFAGDTAASALLANDVGLIGRSFKYHRPRGILAHGVAEPNALLDIDRGGGRRDPNNRASVVEAIDGLILRSQNRWPSLGLDLGALLGGTGRIFSAGFYYKTFMWPRRFWDAFYEPVIRRMAGLGSAPKHVDPDTYAHRFAFCDVLVVGAGPAGLVAATAAAHAGQRVILVDEQAELGGSLLHDISSNIDGLAPWPWLERAIDRLRGMSGVTLLLRTTAIGYHNDNLVTLAERFPDRTDPALQPLRERLWQVRAKRVVLATGAHERPLTFENNDLPGVMLADSVRAYVNRYAVAPGRTIAIVTNNASAYRAALDAQAAGLDVQVFDRRRPPVGAPEIAAALAAGIKVYTNAAPIRAAGRKNVKALEVRIESAGAEGRTIHVACDCIAMSGGWTPAVHLFSQARGKLRFDERLSAFIPHTAAQAVLGAGAVQGLVSLSACFTDGVRAGGGNAAFEPVVAEAFAGDETAELASTLPLTDGSKCFVDFQNDVVASDIALAVREGFESVEHVKRYTTTGMATDQGKTSNMAALAIMQSLLNKPIPEIGTTTFRAPYTPVTFGCLAGRSRGALFEPLRKTPIDPWAEAHGAKFENVAQWRRARYFPKMEERMGDAVNRECRAVRQGVGIFDASTLGKIEVVGPDVAEFLNRIYINAWTKLGVGKCRYGVMLRESGFILDDGVVARLADDRFHVTTTTGGAPRVLAHMEDYLQTEWPDLKVFLTSVTEQWAVIALQGPFARDVLAQLTDIDLSAEGFPHMAVKTGKVCGVRTRLFKVSFTGEPGFEINVPATEAMMVWTQLLKRGAAWGITPYGTETMHVLRAERGFIIVGQETDGTVTPDDVGLAGMISKAKSDFVGKRSLRLQDLQRPNRKQLVGILTKDPGLVLEEGAQIVGDRRGGLSLGHVTSSYWSETLGRSIALGLVSSGRERIGKMLYATTEGGVAPVILSQSAFFDAEGERLRA